MTYPHRLVGGIFLPAPAGVAPGSVPGWCVAPGKAAGRPGPKSCAESFWRLAPARRVKAASHRLVASSPQPPAPARRFRLFHRLTLDCGSPAPDVRKRLSPTRLHRRFHRCSDAGYPPEGATLSTAHVRPRPALPALNDVRVRPMLAYGSTLRAVIDGRGRTSAAKAPGSDFTGIMAAAAAGLRVVPGSAFLRSACRCAVPGDFRRLPRRRRSRIRHRLTACVGTRCWGHRYGSVADANTRALNGGPPLPLGAGGRRGPVAHLTGRDFRTCFTPFGPSPPVRLLMSPVVGIELRGFWATDVSRLSITPSSAFLTRARRSWSADRRAG